LNADISIYLLVYRIVDVESGLLARDQDGAGQFFGVGRHGAVSEKNLL
jgi:hypothetical protein